MSFSENQDYEFSHDDESKNTGNVKDSNSIQNSYIKNNNNDNNNIPKKNRTLQFYKYLFYSMKTEIKSHDFLKLLRNSNTAELSIWTISVVLYANIPKNYPINKEGETSSIRYNGIFIWLHLVHIVRACLGMFVGYKLPRNFQIMDILQNISENKLETTLFNDIIRETLLNHIISKIKERKKIILAYFFLTLVNMLFDIIEFFVLLSKITRSPSNEKNIFITFLLIVIIYLVIDFSYIFFAGQLKYAFPPIYLKPITAAYYGLVERAMIVFKLRKKRTDIVSEDKAQKSSGQYVRSTHDINNGGVNILEYIVKDSFGFNQNNEDKYLPQFKEQIRNNEEIKKSNEPISNEILN